MQRINAKKNVISGNSKIKNTNSIIKTIPNGNTNEEIPQNSRNNEINRSNKFLSIQERQKIIREINKSQNRFNLLKSSPLKEDNMKINSNNQNILYVKKRKNYIARSNEKISHEKRKMELVNGINNVKLPENKILVRKAINNKGKYENNVKYYNITKIKNWKNIDDKDSKNYGFFQDNNKNYNIYENKNIKTENNKVLYKDEIYKKPINGKIHNKICVNLNNAYIKKNNRHKNIDSNLNINIMDSAQKEKINCTKRKNMNGSKKTIFNMINNYNTQTIKNKDSINDSYNQNIFKTINSNTYLKRNKSISNISTNTKINHFVNNLKAINNSPKYFYQNKKPENNKNEIFSIYSKNRSISTKKNMKVKKPLFLREENTINNYNILKLNKYNYFINDDFNNNNILTEMNDNRINNTLMKYSRKNLDNNDLFPKKPLLDTNLISNDLLNKLVEKDLISFTYNIDKFNNENYNKPSEKELNANDTNDKNFESPKKNISYIKTDISRNKNNELYLTLSESSKKLKKYKTLSVHSNKDEEEKDNNLKSGKSRNRHGLKSSRNISHKDFGNYLITKEVTFPIKIRRSISYYNSDDDIMNSNSKREIENERSNLLLQNNSLKNIKNKSKKFFNLYHISKDVINNESERTRSQSKDYYFKYLSKKINNDILNEDKINKLGKELYNIEFFNNNKRAKPNFNNPFIKTRSITMNNKNNKDFNNENIFEKNSIDNSIQNNLITNKPDLKLDISNGMHNSQNNIQNVNLNSIDDGSFNSNKEEIINTYEAQEINNNLELKRKNLKEKERKSKLNIQQKKNIEFGQREEIGIISENDFNKKQSKEYENKINFNINKRPEMNEEIIVEKNNQNIILNPKRKCKKESNKIYFKEKEIKEYENINQIKFIKLPIKPIKNNYLNKENQNIFPIFSDVLENLNIITPNNYFSVKDRILKLLGNNDNNILKEFVTVVYSIAIKQKEFQPIYSKLFKDLDKFYHKKDKSKTIIRTHLMKLCKSNFKRIKTNLENIKYISNDINFIGELINSQMVSKKVGLQCLTHLFNKFDKYNEDKNFVNRKEEKYLYLDNIINLLNKFASCIYCYQKQKIRDNELIYFEEEIDKDLELLKKILNDTKNNDMPSKTKINLLILIKKSEDDWKLTVFEQHKNNLLKSMNQNISDDFNNI